MDAVLTVRGADKRYGSIRALAGADLTLTRGQCLGLLGPNGAGKTTLVRAIAGRVRLDAGAITLLGADLGKGGSAVRPAPAIRAARQRLGVVPQDIALYGLLTAAENLAAFGTYHGVTGQTLRERIDWALTWTGLAERTAMRVAAFSGGMKRRLNIACSVLHRPEVVLLDEPTVGVDPQSRERIWEMLAELRKSGTSLLLTTHQLDEAESVCTEIAVFDHGRAIAAGTLDALVSHTVGARRTIAIALDREPGADEARKLASAAAEAGHAVDLCGSVLQCTTEDVVETLAVLLGRVREVGLVARDVEVAPPSLHTVFLHLTGRELRE